MEGHRGPREPNRAPGRDVIVDPVLYLEATSFVTGEIQHVDGGQSVGTDNTGAGPGIAALVGK